MSADATPADATPNAVLERIIIKKFDGNLTPEECETAIPAEVIVIEQGVLVSHERREDERQCR